MIFKRIGLFDPRSQTKLKELLQNWFDNHGIEIRLLPWNSPERFDLDLVLALGGDGTVLAAFEKFHYCPILAINYGTLGFLTAGNKEELNSVLGAVLAGDYFISKRSVLECHYPGGVVHALNEVVIKGSTHIITIDCFINGNHIRKIRGDGVIVGTPTGSTAYLLSAGSPIVMPEVRCMILTGLNEYNFTARHLVVQPDVDIKLTIQEDTFEKQIFLSTDGRNRIPLNVKDEIQIKESKRQARFIFVDKNYFFNNLTTRLAW